MDNREMLHKWLEEHYTELKDNEDLQTAHKSGLIRVATYLALLGIVFVLLCLLTAFMPLSPDTSAEWQKIISVLDVCVIGICCICAFICMVKSVQYFVMSLTCKSLEGVQVGRGFIPLELIAHLKKDYD